MIIFSCGGIFVSVLNIYDTESHNKELHENNIILEQTNNELRLEIENCCKCSTTSKNYEIKQTIRERSTD